MTNKLAVVIVIVIIIAAAAFYFLTRKPEIAVLGTVISKNETLPVCTWKTQSFCVNVSKTVVIKTAAGKEVKLALQAEAKVFNENGNEADFDYLRPTFEIEATGKQGKTDFKARQVRVMRAPRIIVTAPLPDSAVGLPLVLKGEAMVFENTFNYRLKDASGKILKTGFGMTQAKDVGIYGEFTVDIIYPKPNINTGILEVFEINAQDGTEIEKVAVPVRFETPAGQTIKVFFPKADSANTDCGLVYPLDRKIAPGEDPVNGALGELLEGVTAAEAKQGYLTTINPGVLIKGIEIKSGIASADFTEELQRGVGGSCKVTAIRAQITETLKQFPGVNQVVISIDGRSEDILQP